MINLSKEELGLIHYSLLKLIEQIDKRIDENPPFFEELSWYKDAVEKQIKSRDLALKIAKCYAEIH